MRSVRRSKLNIPRTKDLLLGLDQSKVSNPKGVLKEVIDLMDHSRTTYGRPNATGQDVIKALSYERDKERTGRLEKLETLLDEVNDALNYLDLMLQGKRPPLDIWRNRHGEPDGLPEAKH